MNAENAKRRVASAKEEAALYKCSCVSRVSAMEARRGNGEGGQETIDAPRHRSSCMASSAQAVVPSGLLAQSSAVRASRNDVVSGMLQGQKACWFGVHKSAGHGQRYLPDHCPQRSFPAIAHTPRSPPRWARNSHRCLLQESPTPWGSARHGPRAAFAYRGLMLPVKEHEAQ